MMRIGIAIDTFCPHRGGAEYWTYRFVQHLLRLRHQVHVVAVEFSAAGLDLPIVVHRLAPGLSRLQRASVSETIFRDLRLDVIHDMGLGWHCDLFHSHVGSRIAHLHKKQIGRPWPEVALKRITSRLLPRYREFRQLTERQLSNPQTLVLAVSEMVARDYREYHQIPDQRLRVVYNGVDTDIFSPGQRGVHRVGVRRALGISASDLAVLFVGHNHQLKGLSTAVRAVEQLRRTGQSVHLIVLGGPTRGKRYPGTAAKQTTSVTYVGRVTNSAPYYAAADVFVLPTRYDACSLSLLEAAASGLPVITTRANGASGLMTDRKEGFLLDDPADNDSLFRHLHALRDEGLRSEMGRASRQLAVNCTLQKNFDQVLAVYDEILDHRAGGYRPAVA